MILFVFGAGTVIAQDVRYDFDKNKDFSKYKTYKMRPRKRYGPIRPQAAGRTASDLIAFLRVAMQRETTSIGQHLKTPRAAGIAGIVFCVLSITSQLLIMSAIPPYGQGSAIEVVKHSQTISRSLNLVPFAGIAFLWFVGVLRDHLGEFEDRFFATVFFGSGLLYIAMFFASAALAGGLLGALSSGTEDLVRSGAYAVSRADINQMLNVYGIKMAGVFMISFSTISLRTRIVPRWISFLGWALALLLLLSIGTIAWAPMVFPVWVALLSIRILTEKFRSQSDASQNSTFVSS